MTIVLNDVHSRCCRFGGGYLNIYEIMILLDKMGRKFIYSVYNTAYFPFFVNGWDSDWNYG